MSPRTRHPQLVDWACRLYRPVIWLYPPSLRREFRHELLVTFRNRAEDAFARGSLLEIVTFTVHIAADWLRTLVLADQDEPPQLSLLGLGGDAQACGSFDRSTFSASLFLATLGVVLLIMGWYGWLEMTAQILRTHR